MSEVVKARRLEFGFGIEQVCFGVPVLPLAV